MRVHEVFDADSHALRRRAWASDSGPVYRQEDYDDAGRLVQVINGWVNPDVPMPEDAIALWRARAGVRKNCSGRRITR